MFARNLACGVPVIVACVSIKRHLNVSTLSCLFLIFVCVFRAISHDGANIYLQLSLALNYCLASLGLANAFCSMECQSTQCVNKIGMSNNSDFRGGQFIYLK